MNNKVALNIVLFIFFVGGVGYYVYPRTALGPQTSTETGDGVVCTMEAKQCPDGSYVGREGPKCEFKECPKADKLVSNTITLAIGESGTIGGVRITPQRIEEDSRCPVDVTCIQAGTVRVLVGIVPGVESVTFKLGDSVLVNRGIKLLLSEVTPVKNSKVSFGVRDYRFTFVEQKITGEVTYHNANADLIVVTSPAVAERVGHSIVVVGKARGGWFSEGTFYIEVLDTQGKFLGSGNAKAEGDWMTSNFVPFTAQIKVPDAYTGSATILFHKDNPSGLPQNESSMAFPLFIN